MAKNNMYEDFKKEFVQFYDDNAKSCLYQPTKPLNDFLGSEVQGLIQKMKDKMPKYSIGLAANQIAISKQMFIMEYNPPKNLKEYHVDFEAVPLQIHINPRIAAASDTRIAYWHGCLSAINELMGEIATYKWLEFESVNEKGELVSGRMDGMGAIIFQHEFCHLLGGLYLDCAERKIERKALQKLFKSGEEKIYREVDASVPLLLDGYCIGETIEEYERRKKR